VSKKAFGLLSVLILVLIFSYLSISIIQNHTLSSKIDTIKYLHLQANIHMFKIKKYITTHNNSQINNYILADDRFILTVHINDINISTKIYHIHLKNEENTINIYENIIK